MRQETQAELGVFAFEMTSDALIYLAKLRVVPFHQRIPPPGRLFPDDYSETPTRELFDLVRDNPNVGEFGTFIRYGGQVRLAAAHPSVGYWTLYRYFISPDSRRAIMVAPVEPRDVPPSWEGYARQGRPDYWAQFQLINLESGTVTRPVDAPTAEALYNYGFTLPQTRAIWDSNSRTVLLINSGVPASPGGQPHILSLDTTTSEVSLGPAIDTRYQASASLQDVTWAGVGHPVVLYSDAGATHFDFADHSSNAISPPARAETINDRLAIGPSLWLEIREGMNAPPDVFLVTPEIATRLTALNPQFESLAPLPFQLFRWATVDGRDHEGGLLLPSDGCSRPCALAVQIGYWDAGAFTPDSTIGTNFGAQALAARGVAVLSVNIHDAGVAQHQGVIAEANQMIHIVEAAVFALARERTIDLHRVGLSGFSRSAQHVKVAITRRSQRVRWAAASTGDGGDSSYSSYGFYAVGLNISSFQREIESNYGGSFWTQKRNWTNLAPGFNLENSQTPLLLEPHSVGSLFLDWEFYSGFRILQRPVDIAYIPASEHWLSQPRDIAFSQQTSVDWFLFWLQGYENPESSVEQYDRWRAIRESQCRAYEGGNEPWYCDGQMPSPH